MRRQRWRVLRHQFTPVGDLRFLRGTQLQRGATARDSEVDVWVPVPSPAQPAHPGAGDQHPTRRAGPPCRCAWVNCRSAGSSAPVYARVECAFALPAASCDASGCARGFGSDGARPAPLCTVEHRPGVVPGRPAPIEFGENRSACRRLLAPDHRVGVGRMTGVAVHPHEYSGRATMLNSSP